jgi:hypothetical protein
MSKELTSAGRRGRLGMLYMERRNTRGPTVIRGVLRGWPAEDWEHKGGDPIIYVFESTLETGKISPTSLTLGIIRKDGILASLPHTARQDLQSAINWDLEGYLAFNGERLKEIPVANNIGRVCKLAVKFFTRSDVDTAPFLDRWPSEWKKQLKDFLE